MSDWEYINVYCADPSKRGDFYISAHGEKDLNKALANLCGALDKKQIQMAIKRARQRSLKAGKELGAKLAREEYTARKSAIKNRFITKILNDGAIGYVRFSGFPGMNLIHFLPRPNRPAIRPRKGVTVQVKRDGPRKVPKGKREDSSKPFIARLKKKGSELGVFVRYGKGRKRHMLYGPSPIQALRYYYRPEKIRDRIKEVFANRLTHELDVRLKGIVR